MGCPPDDVSKGRRTLIGTWWLVFHEVGEEEWVRCGPGDTLVAPINTMHAFHNRTDEVSRFVSSSVYYHEVYFNEYARIVNVNVDDPLPQEKEPDGAG